MAETVDRGHGGTPAPYDGRFGERFDDEVDVRGIWYILAGLAVLCLVGIVLAWGAMAFLEARIEPVAVSPIPEAAEKRLPPGPLLQPKPEVEMQALWTEMAQRLGAPVGPKKPLPDSGAGWGWVDQAAGTAHIPIDRAIDLLLTQGLPTRVETAPAIGEATGASTEGAADETAEGDENPEGAATEGATDDAPAGGSEGGH